MPPYRFISYLLSRRFPAYTEDFRKLVSQVVRERNDVELLENDTLDFIRKAAMVRISKLIIPGETIDDQVSSVDLDENGYIVPLAAKHLKNYLNAVRDYEDSLYESSLEYLYEEHHRERSIEIQDEVSKGEQRDRLDFFSFPHAVADFERWFAMPSWTVDEAVALTLSKAPTIVNSATLWPHLHFSPFRTEYKRRIDIVGRAVKGGDLTENIVPAKFLTWLSKNEVILPSELPEKITDSIISQLERNQIRNPHETRVKNNLLRIVAAAVFARHEIDPLTPTMLTLSSKELEMIGDNLSFIGKSKVGSKTVSKYLNDALRLVRIENLKH